MKIRPYQPGDEAVQTEIYNEAAAPLVKFKPATVDEVKRRCRAKDFDPASHLFAEDRGRIVGYCSFHPNGRVSYPWCRPGCEDAAEGLFQHVLQAMQNRKLPSVFTAYRADWLKQQTFFLEHGFHLAREMVNFVLDMADLPTMTIHRTSSFYPLRREDIPAVRDLAPQALRATTTGELEKHFFENPYFGMDSAFVLRGHKDNTPLAACVVIANPAYADPKAVDPAMPCFRLGAFGTEGMQTKRINGLFSVLARNDGNLMTLCLAALDYAIFLLDRTDLGVLGAQVPSDVSHLLRFYQHHFRRQGSFPVLERLL